MKKNPERLSGIPIKSVISKSTLEVQPKYKSNNNKNPIPSQNCNIPPNSSYLKLVEKHPAEIDAIKKKYIPKLEPFIINKAKYNRSTKNAVNVPIPARIRAII